MDSSQATTRRDFLSSASTAVAAAAVGSIVSAKSLRAAEQVGANDRIGLGIIGIGPRCTYDLTAMLKFPDVQCIAISDVQASRRDAGKALVDGHYGNKDCVLYRDFREMLQIAAISMRSWLPPVIAGTPKHR